MAKTRSKGAENKQYPPVGLRHGTDRHDCNKMPVLEFCRGTDEDVVLIDGL